LLRAVGAEPGLEPAPAVDDELEWLHSAEYIAAVRHFSAEPHAAMRASGATGIGPGDDPPFAGMHEAAAAVAGGSIRAIEAILRGDVEHAYHPGGGLHHAMRSKASGFCIYNDVALAIARARRDGLRVLYVDLDVHHGDGVQALHYADPNVLTISLHESGLWLFPGSGFVDEFGEGIAAGTSVNVPLEPRCGPGPWLAALRAVVPALAASFGPDIVVSQHGADGHVWDPLAHLALTTTAMGEAARLVDAVAHRYAGGRWFATGGGGYAVYRVVPRAWALTWLAGAHREAPDALPAAWRERWAGEAALLDDDPLPARFEDEPGIVFGHLVSDSAREEAEKTVELVRTVLVPALLRFAETDGWWRFDGVRQGIGGPRATPPAEGPATAGGGQSKAAGRSEPTVMPLSMPILDRVRLSPRVLPCADPAEGAAILRAALENGAIATGAVVGEWLVGVALAAPERAGGGDGSGDASGDAQGSGGEPASHDKRRSGDQAGVASLIALGVAPEWRLRGIAAAMLRALVAESDRLGLAVVALHTVAERDPFAPLPRAVRQGVAESLLLAAGFSVRPAPPAVAATDPGSFAAFRLPPSASGRLAAHVARLVGAHGPRISP
jgi:acetoin utilization protein AcuC